MAEYADAPAAYPEVHFMTAPIRAAARAAGTASWSTCGPGRRTGSPAPSPRPTSSAASAPYGLICRNGNPCCASGTARQAVGVSHAQEHNHEDMFEPPGWEERYSGEETDLERATPTRSWSPRSPG